MLTFQQVARRVGRKSREFFIRVGFIEKPRFYLQARDPGYVRQSLQGRASRLKKKPHCGAGSRRPRKDIEVPFHDWDINLLKRLGPL